MKKLFGLFIGLLLIVFATNAFAYEYKTRTWRWCGYLNNNDYIVYKVGAQIRLTKIGIKTSVVTSMDDYPVGISDDNKILAFTQVEIGPNQYTRHMILWEPIESDGWQRRVLLQGDANHNYAPISISDDGEKILFREHKTNMSYTWINGVITALPGNFVGLEINNYGDVVGVKGYPYRCRAALWKNGTLTLLGSSKSYAYDINNLGQIVGRWGQAVVWENGDVTFLGEKEATDINNLGHVIGLTWVGVFLYKDGATCDIDDLINPSLEIQIFNTIDINDKGTMLVFGKRHGVFSWYILTPIVNTPPIADAGPSIDIFSENQLGMLIAGVASDEDGDELIYRWSVGGMDLTDWLLVGENGEAYLDMSTIPDLFDVGVHILALEVDDGKEIVIDEMVLTIYNSSPHAFPTGVGTYEVNTLVVLAGSVSDFDGDLLTYEWLEGAQVLFSGEISSIYHGTPVEIIPYEISTLSIGIHNLILRVNDGVNPSVEASIVVEIVDTGDPTLSPIANDYMLWPPNHKMANIFIEANASDNSGEPVTLSVIITSNEPQDGLGDGDMSPDWTELTIDQENGIIAFQLRAERSGLGDGRIYTISITATDTSGNSSTANLEIIVPHDRRHK